ncbi:MAG TPA: DUF1800 domain-containing protein [Candidatus Sulfotelmatobacter sp.]|nr:DUF1800 domain-containing protein [Candidatus Sulfotelmatobacter sp.]
MKSSIAKAVLAVACVSLASTVPQLVAKKKNVSADHGPNEQKRAAHALNRLTFGPRPGDMQQVMAMGVDRWIDLQLHPDKIPDPSVEARLAPLRTLHMSSKEIMEEFPDNQMIKQVMSGKRPMPSDPVRRAIYQVQVARLEAKQERKREAARSVEPPPQPTEPSANESAKTAEELAAAAAASPDAQPADNASMTANGSTGEMASNAAATNEMANDNSSPAPEPKMTPEEEAEARRREDRLYADLKVQSLIDLPPDERYKKVLAMTPEEQLAFADTLRGGKGQEFLTGLDPKQREVLLAMNNPQVVVVEELSQAKLYRAIYSERQLEEVMTDFWFNHFNVFIGKGPERLLVTNYEQQVIRPHALGKFEDLLVATAKSPAMLFYLDNWMSVGPNSLQATGGPGPVVRRGPYGRPRMYPRPNPNAHRRQNNGLNENYGRELLELHTLSVNGGYSQRDVTEVAKVFTGWTIDKPADGMSFHYEARMHEPGPKFVLGHHIKPKGEDEGREVLHMLATSPQTAHFISLKLAQRFVSDDPPPALVDRMAKTFQKKKGDIREVLSTLFHSPEFWDDGTYRAKVKTPLEFVVSAVRATGADVQNAIPLVMQLQKMGMPLYAAQPPTGYSMKSDAWVSSSALLNRMNFALALTAGKVRGVSLDSVQLAGGPPAPPDASTALSTMEAKLLASDVSKQTHDSIVAQLESPSKNDSAQPVSKPKQEANRPPDTSTIAGLLLGSPEFQRR